MEKRIKQRIGALKTLNGRMNSEMAGLRQTRRQADDRLHVIKEKLSVIDEEIGEAERCLRSALDPGSDLALDEYQMLIDYLDYQQRIRFNNERQQGFAQVRLEKIEEEMIQQGLKIRGMENLLERRARELALAKEHKQLSLLDEMWLQKQKDES
ncbi:hypothetical protein [Candidatus Thiodiazotropha sp. CDECU1]|uniref:hypothetical protein n=1 Tax=Candidatus Thiodiazotropha sp. CDECU1 TaxID=3065865 RepID=UPI00292F5BE6|nr:hypothetical protein [Candidatus Thiodiazotropha sp. CDECU1]